MMTQQIQQQTHNDEIDLKQVFRIMAKYKVSIILITLLFFIGSAVFAYYKQNIYASHATIEVLEDNSNGVSSTDFMVKAFGGNAYNMDNEIATIQSRYIVQKALEKLNLTTQYFAYNKLLKKTELYKNSPFIVNNILVAEPIYYKTFELEPIDDKSFRLKIKPLSLFSIKGILVEAGIQQLEDDEKIEYDKVHKYGEQIKTAWFTFSIDKLANLEAEKYTFNFIPQDLLYDVFSDGLSVSLASEFGSIIDLTYQDTVSLRAAEILNAIANTYIEEGIKEKTKIAELTLGFIDSQLDAINSKLTASEQNLQNFKVNNNVVNLQNKLAVDTEKVAAYESEQQKLQTEINILTNLQHYMDNNSDLSGLTLGTINFADKSLASLVQKLQEMTEERNLLLVDYTELHPEVIKLTQSIVSTKRAIKRALSSSLRQLKQRNTDLQRMISKYNKSLDSLPSKEKALAELSRPLKVNESVYEYLLQKKAETAILKSSTIADARILDAAREEPIPIKPKRKLIVIVGLILGFILGLAQAFFREFLVNTIQNAEDIERYTSLPIYGVIPLNKDKMTKNIYMEAFRNIRTNLQFLPGNENNKVISITSSVSGEGKTTIVSSLAEVLARGNKKVIALDLDMRKASLHKRFDLNNNIGMSNYLTGQNSLEDVIQETDVYGLKVITTGPLPPNPSELILSSMFTQLLETLREEYDYIIIDTPPAGLVTDATIIMNYSDISFFVVRAKYTRKEFVKNIDRIAKEHSHNRIGLILNATLIGSEYGYGYGASYAYGYGNAQYYKDRG
jgi:capsular exopolysaccharide synthesis family protein